MAIRTLLHGRFREGPVFGNLIETTEPGEENGPKDLSWEVACDECVDYFCTGLLKREAKEEIADHARTVHGIEPQQNVGWV